MGSATSSMAAKFAFFPPNPPSYNVYVDESSGKLRMSDAIHQREDVDIVKLDTKKGNEIVAMYVKNPSASLTVLFSHGNAAVLGQMYHIFTELSLHLGVNLMGKLLISSICLYHQPSLFCDILLSLEPQFFFNFFFYSHFLKYCILPLKCVTLLLSSNIDKIPLINCPVLVIHGTEDEVVDFSHGKQFGNSVMRNMNLYGLKGGNYCNFELFPEYLRHLKKFISAIEKLPCVENVIEHSKDHLDLTSNSTKHMDMGRPSTERREKSTHSTGEGEKSKLITDNKEKARSSTDKRERSRKSLDRSGRPRNSIDQSERARNSFDRLGDMVRSVGLCNVDCLKQTASEA
ncbi:alpha/beta hydrolase domain-containing protein 17B-like [Quillaja saponaria]|uniref:Alpha/beta hydrolase domain-containing protein 17B-like n=1 Tax=Quillaja saponaria TaxID=32244 RepID=A0AAD7L9K7_QUISA|nr:alpha/beta hydrolase domain-containing protein 17B-like [Quillaja saponaria]